MTPEFALVLTAVFGALAALAAAWMNDRRTVQRAIFEGNRALVDNLQEERGELKERISVLENKVDMVLMQGRYKDDYINELRNHIETGKPPPPPNYPAALMGIAAAIAAGEGVHHS